MSSKNTKDYSNYLHIPELLKQQKLLTNKHDELQFIIVHQVLELWFKLIIFELKSLRKNIYEENIPQTLHLTKRIQTIIKHLTSSFDIIETMRPYDFLQFREQLNPASGLQSFQFKEIEFICGLRDKRFYKIHTDKTLKILQDESENPSLWDAYLFILKQKKLKIETEEDILESIIFILENLFDQPIGQLTESLVEFDELFSIWRYRHVKMVIRMIGFRPGTGKRDVEKLSKQGYQSMNSNGVEYLKSTLDKTFFPLLWEARTFVKK